MTQVLYAKNLYAIQMIKDSSTVIVDGSLKVIAIPVFSDNEVGRTDLDGLKVVYER